MSLFSFVHNRLQISIFRYFLHYISIVLSHRFRIRDVLQVRASCKTRARCETYRPHWSALVRRMRRFGRSTRDKQRSPVRLFIGHAVRHLTPEFDRTKSRTENGTMRNRNDGRNGRTGTTINADRHRPAASPRIQFARTAQKMKFNTRRMRISSVKSDGFHAAREID